MSTLANRCDVCLNIFLQNMNPILKSYRPPKQLNRLMKRHVLAVLLIFGHLPLACATDEEDLFALPLEQLLNVKISSASRTAQSSSDTPAAVSVLTKADIRTFGWRTLAEALSAIRGLYISNDRKYTSVGQRGYLKTGDYNSRVLLMIDGRRMNDNVFDEGHFGEDFLLDMDMIERIEYMSGSGSTLYGANAMLGVINVVTKHGGDIKGTQLAADVGSFGTYRGRLSYGDKFSNGAEVLLNGSEYYSGGVKNLHYDEFQSINNGNAYKMDVERATKLFGKFSFEGLTLTAGYADRYKRLPTGLNQSIFNDKDNFVRDKRAYANLDYDKALTNTLSLQVRGFYQGLEYYSHSPSDLSFLGVNRTVFYDAASGRWWGGDITFIGTQFQDHTWAAGIDFQYDQRQHLEHYFINPPNFLSGSSNRDGWRAGLYFEDEYRFAKDWLLNVGMRLDYHHMVNNLNFSPRVGLIWHATPELTAKLIYSRAFRAPNVFERDFEIMPFRYGNPNNKAEHITSYEAIAEWQSDDGIKLLGSFFYNKMHDFLEIQEQSSMNIYTNDDHMHMYGVELDAQKRWKEGRLLKASWAYTQGYDEDQCGVWAANSPRHLIKLHYAEPLFDKKANLALEGLMVSRRKTLSDRSARAYSLLNLNLSTAQLFYGWQASVGIYNLFDSHYQMVAPEGHLQDTLDMNGRSVRFKLEYQF